MQVTMLLMLTYPIVMKEVSTETATDFINDLRSFNFPEFNDSFLKGLGKEIPLFMKHVNAEFDWDAVVGAKEYDKKLQEKKLAAELLAVYNSSSSTNRVFSEIYTDESHIKSWKDDASECARRVWEWWRSRLVGSNTFMYFPTALRLIILVQSSSAFIERVFSQLKLIIEQIGEAALESTLEARAFVRMNKMVYGM
jgi:hypothetical protein